MDRYLTERANKSHPMDIPILGICGIFLAGMLSVLGENFDTNDLLVSIIASAILLALFIVPIVRISIRRLRQRDARALARCFAEHREELFPIPELERQVKVLGNARRRVEKLINQGMLKEVRLEPGEDAVRLLTVLNPKPVIKYIDIVCPHCCGTNRVPQDNRGRCAYCDSLLPLPGSRS